MATAAANDRQGGPESLPEAVGASNSRHAARFGRGVYEAGIDTVRLLYRLHDERQQERAHQLLGYVPEAIDGLRWGYLRDHELVWVEGRMVQLLTRPGDRSLMPAAALPDAQQEARRVLDVLRLSDAREVGVARLDVTAGVEFDRPAQGWAVLRGMAALDAPRRKTEVWHQRGRPETVYLATAGGAKRERIYDKGLEAGDAPAGTRLRFEAQMRFPKRVRTTAGWWTMERVHESFEGRYAPMARAADGVRVAGEAELRAVVRELVAEGKLGPVQARTLLGHLAAESVGIPTSNRTRRRQRAELRRLGLAQALDGLEESGVDVELGDVLDELVTAEAWRA